MGPMFLGLPKSSAFAVHGGHTNKKNAFYDGQFMTVIQKTSLKKG